MALIFVGRFKLAGQEILCIFGDFWRKSRFPTLEAKLLTPLISKAFWAKVLKFWFLALCVHVIMKISERVSENKIEGVDAPL